MEGEVLLQGNNEFGQLCLGEVFGKMVPFFPEFRKIDFFKEQKLFVLDVTFGFTSGHILAESEDNSMRVFGFGKSDKG